MKSLGFGRYLLGNCAAAALLAGCGGSQPPIGAPGAMPQSVTQRTTGSSGNLLYAASSDTFIFMFNYPSGSYIGEFEPQDLLSIVGMCADTSGNIYVVGYNGQTVIAKYAHGATKPTWTTELSATYYGHSCAVDPTTGNLAVFSNQYSFEDGANVVMIFPNGSGSSGTPTYYTIPNTMAYASFCTYDNAGNLYADPSENENRDRGVIAELPKGGSSFSIITPTKNIRLGQLQWVSGHLAASDRGTVYRLAISGSRAKIVGETKAPGKLLPMWIQDSKTLISPYEQHGNELAFWNYPSGGTPTKIISGVNKRFLRIISVLVSATGTR